MENLRQAVNDGAYPFAFSEVSNDPSLPPVGFAWGNLTVLEAPRLAIVGTRNASTYGRAVAQKFAEAIAACGVTIVSGGAHGIDAAAHKGALAVNGKTVAILITGIERSYPLEHRGLFKQIRESGCLISQFAVGATAGKFRPLIRNQTVAALSEALLVVEAPLQSGSLNTAKAAVQLGRQVFVVPANIDADGFRGSHALIRDGATLVEHPDQILEAMGILKMAAPVGMPPDLTDVQQRILEVLTTEPLASEFVAERTGLDPADVLSELTMLELEGIVIRDFGGFCKKPI